MSKYTKAKGKIQTAGQEKIGSDDSGTRTGRQCVLFYWCDVPLLVPPGGQLVGDALVGNRQNQ